ncbi:MAG: hypothetical protein V3R95_00490 [Dehalococcoidia bacterium]
MLADVLSTNVLLPVAVVEAAVAAEGALMLFAVVLGTLFGGVAATLLRQWRDAVLAPAHVGGLPHRRLAAGRRPTMAVTMGARGGLVFVPHEARRHAA